MLVIQGYVVLMIGIGLKLAISSYIFRNLSLWKKLIVFSVSPLLLAIEIYKDFKKGGCNVKNS